MTMPENSFWMASSTSASESDVSLNLPRAMCRRNTRMSPWLRVSSTLSSMGENTLESAALICASSRDVTKTFTQSGRFGNESATSASMVLRCSRGSSSSASMPMTQLCPGASTSDSGPQTSTAKRSAGCMSSRSPPSSTIPGNLARSCASKPGTVSQSMAARERMIVAGLDAAASSWRQRCHAMAAPRRRCRSSSTEKATLLPVPPPPMSQKSLSVDAASLASQASNAAKTHSRVPVMCSRSLSAWSVEWFSAWSVTVGPSSQSATQIECSAARHAASASPRGTTPPSSKRRSNAAVQRPRGTRPRAASLVSASPSAAAPSVETADPIPGR
mmetsp:Transcript_17829/g.61558  ORF Transcript_17829/g.61558 Transcript_17829/m.61558 type:complete len:331 (-) Transcript_17829:127-1119(-)